MPTTDLPRPDGSTETIELRPPPDLKLDLSIAPVRLAFAAAHIVTRPDYKWSDGKTNPTSTEAIDWEATLGLMTTGETFAIDIIPWRRASSWLPLTPLRLTGTVLAD